jgi:sec-independent protein translocase protein TatB
MFDLTSSKLMILAIVALLVVGPKDFPILLRTIGKYLGVIRRQAAEFRTQFNEAINEAEMAELRKEFESVSEQVESTMREGGAAIDSQLDEARSGIDSALDDVRRDVGVPVGRDSPPDAALPPPDDPSPSGSEPEPASDDSPRVSEKTGT